ncbi:hypothetical protein [Gemmobacter caeruleus]|uniref:hypothetical protein n=1 Tax=Gemmobacter caeruleus TaxID=2595004 RepID=UPI0011EE005B|nr:hypothetical protein [Gemmobacter caeruleus]
MLGVVIWSCQETGRAIIWCADHRDLAHYDGPPRGVTRIGVEVGDLVELSFQPGNAARRCHALRLVEPGYFPEIAEELKGNRRAIAAA